MGRTPYLQPVHVQGDVSLLGRMAEVKIEKRTANSLHGALLQEQRA
jgi:tRNA-2-methylthio-N6-dimethylallyladenosine synthase